MSSNGWMITITVLTNRERVDRRGERRRGEGGRREDKKEKESGCV